jgi:hypothetical protein
LDFGFWILDFGFWVLGLMFHMIGFRVWSLGSGINVQHGRVLGFRVF